MLNLATAEITQFAHAVGPIGNRRPSRKPATHQPKIALRSRVPGRERWYVDTLEDNPRLAAAVELVMRTEEGIEEVRANPLTGRVLVRFRPWSVSESIEALLTRAIEAGPMSREEFAALRPTEAPRSISKELLTAEVACSLSHMLLFGGFCPIGLAATGVLMLLHRRSRTHTHG